MKELKDLRRLSEETAEDTFINMLLSNEPMSQPKLPAGYPSGGGLEARDYQQFITDSLQRRKEVKHSIRGSKLVMSPFLDQYAVLNGGLKSGALTTFGAFPLPGYQFSKSNIGLSMMLERGRKAGRVFQEELLNDYMQGLKHIPEFTPVITKLTIGNGDKVNYELSDAMLRSKHKPEVSMTTKCRPNIGTIGHMEVENDLYHIWYTGRQTGKNKIQMTMRVALEQGYFFAGTFITPLYFAMGFKAPTIQ